MNASKISVSFRKNNGANDVFEFDTLSDFLETYPKYESLRWKIQEQISRHKTTFIHDDFELSRIRMAIFRLESSVIIAECIGARNYFPIPKYKELSEKLTDVFQKIGTYNVPKLDGYNFSRVHASEYAYKYIEKQANGKTAKAKRMRSIIYLVYEEIEE